MAYITRQFGLSNNLPQSTTGATHGGCSSAGTSWAAGMMGNAPTVPGTHEVPVPLLSHTGVVIGRKEGRLAAASQSSAILISTPEISASFFRARCNRYENLAPEAGVKFLVPISGASF